MRLDEQHAKGVVFKDSKMKEPEKKIELNVKESKLFEMYVGSEQVFELWFYFIFSLTLENV